MGAAASTDGQITRQSSSYRQGLVLGLTMAEIMLLLVFCLLIALATFLKVEQDKRREVEQRLIAEHAARIIADNAAKAAAEQSNAGGDHDLIEAIRQHPRLAEQFKRLAKSGSREEVDEHWRELVKAQDMIAAAKGQGLSEAEIRQALAQATLQKVRAPDGEVTRNAETVQRIQATMTAAGKTEATPDDIVKVVERGLHPWPPIIRLSEADGYFFQTGSAALTPDFRDKLKDTISDQILASIKEYGVDVVEVVGHTDEQPVGSRASNLDRDLLPVLKDNAAISSLIPADNAGLGLARAASVVSVLLQGQKLAGYKVIPLSGAQLVDVDESLALSGAPGDIRERRRIEIRLRKSDGQSTVAAKPSPARPPAPPKPRRRLKPAPSGVSTNTAESLNLSREH